VRGKTARQAWEAASLQVHDESINGPRIQELSTYISSSCSSISIGNDGRNIEQPKAPVVKASICLVVVRFSRISLSGRAGATFFYWENAKTSKDEDET